MKKKSVFKTIVAVLVSLFCLSAIIVLFRGNPQTDELPRTEVKTINEALTNASGTFRLKLSGESELKVSEEETFINLGSKTTESITIEGGTINVTGGEFGVIQAANGGRLIFKNVTIQDKTANDHSMEYCNYMHFGGKLRFEDCTIDSIYLMTDADAEFVNCTFVSSHSRWYSVWIGDGSARIENCTFTGYRGLKINEFIQQDVLNVTVNGCTFQNLSEKPGVVIGKFITDPSNGAITVTNNKFIDCQYWDIDGSIEGIDGMYETDTLTSEFNFVQENNYVKFTYEGEKEAGIWTDFY